MIFLDWLRLHIFISHPFSIKINAGSSCYADQGRDQDFCFHNSFSIPIQLACQLLIDGFKKKNSFFTLLFFRKLLQRLAMHTVAQILTHKGRSAISVNPGTSVLDALKIMSEQNIGSVIVADADGQFLGIVTERDYSRKVILKGKSSTDTRVEEIMSKDLPHISLRDTVEYCMELMTSNNIRYLPVFSGSEMVGIISMSDVVKETILMQQETISHLQHYISL